MEQKFDYNKAVEELESIAAKVEDPQTGVDDIDICIKRAEELIEACRAYLRGARDRIEGSAPR
ncbi:MAG: exodeoxyribonuclease VII small subunit [Bacteroidales bacterium]|nr:exodeoxyribonuclease VII small subunit [Bacteroidales bacterium]